MKRLCYLVIILIFVAIIGVAFGACKKSESHTVNIQAEGLDVSYMYNNNESYYLLAKGETELAKVFISGAAEEGIYFYLVVDDMYSTKELEVSYNDTLLTAVVYKDKLERITRLSYIVTEVKGKIDITIRGLEDKIKVLQYQIHQNIDIPIYLKRGKDYVEVKPESINLLSEYDISFGEDKALIKVQYGDTFKIYVQDNINNIGYEQEGRQQGIFSAEELESPAELQELEQAGYAISKKEAGGVFFCIYQTILTDTKIIILP